MMPELTRCRCGGEPMIRVGNYYLDRMAYVLCPLCHTRSKVFLIDHPAYKIGDAGEDAYLDESTRYTEEEAIGKAVESWNGGRFRGQ